ncbi:MAG: gliding motility-associated C-terminal domain-containing protein, partial [Bacteroidota bacterium]
FVQVVDTNGCLGNSDTVQVTNSSPTNAISGSVTVCPGDSIVLRSDTGFAIYAWSNGGTADTVFAMAGAITLTATDAAGCSVTSTVTVPSGFALEANFSADPEVGLPGEPVSFTDLTTILTDTTTIQGWSWDFGDSLGNAVVQNPTYIFSMIGRYTVVLDVLSDDGCRDTISREFQVLDGVEAVNIITPNGDGFNDFLVFPFLEFLPVSRLEVFNRWGNQVYQTDHYRNNFDGRFLPAGTYFYVLEIPGVQTIRQDLTILK